MSIDVLRIACDERDGRHFYTVRLLHEFGVGNLTIKKIAQLWEQSSKHDVLFSDYTKGDPDVFVSVMLDPKSIWLEVEKEKQPIGAMYVTDVIPNFDAKGHFTFWDSRASGREPIIWLTAEQLMQRYNLHRITVEIPVYQSGVIRFVKKLGFQEEGKRREAVLYKGVWMPVICFGILRTELEEIIRDGRYTLRDNGIWYPNRNETGGAGSSEDSAKYDDGRKRTVETGDKRST